MVANRVNIEICDLGTLSGIYIWYIFDSCNGEGHFGILIRWTSQNGTPSNSL